MKVFAVVVLLMLLASPCVAGVVPVHDDVMVVASAQNKQKRGQHPPGKVVIKGKGGKVTDVNKKPKKDEKKKSQ